MARLLFVHPHPDDESIACGGAIVAAVEAGHDVHVVTCTGGEEGENQSGVDLGDLPMDEVRRREMADAVVALGSPTHHWLGFRDSGMLGEPANDHPDAFHAADLYEAAARLARLVRRVRPHVVVSDDERGTYGHPDHVKAHRVTERAVALAADEWWTTPDDGAAWDVPKRYVHALGRGRMWSIVEAMREAGLPSPFDGEEVRGPQDLPFGTDDELLTTVVDVAALLDRKRAAMAAHRSQIGPDSFFLNTPPSLAQDAFGVEEFVLVRGTPAPDEGGLERDLLAGVDES